MVVEVIMVGMRKGGEGGKQIQKQEYMMVVVMLRDRKKEML